MTETELSRAIILKKEINKLESFISNAEKVWSGWIVKKDTKYILRSQAYGVVSMDHYELDTKLKNEMLDVLRKRLREIKDELKGI